MKTYNVKYDIDQEVFILTNKTIFQSTIEKIRIIETRPWINGNDNMKEMNGVEIEYLVVTHKEEYGERTPRSCLYVYDWYKQEDVFTTKEELIQKIK